jgi:type I restriction enzyme S subunit
MADGAAYPAINPSVIMNMGINLPSNEILEMFHNITGNLLKKAFNNLAENKILSETRDTLLPKLMSGKIEVKN